MQRGSAAIFKRFLPIAMATAIAALLATGQALSFWAQSDARMFDQLSTIAPARPAEPGVVIVAIDEASMAAIGKQWPWPRHIHARLIEALFAAGAKTVGFDIVFAEPSNPADDEALASAVNQHLVLAASEQVIVRPYGIEMVRTLPMPQLTKAGARVGLASLNRDGDGVLRRMPVYTNSFAGELVRQAQGLPRPPPRQKGQLIQYLGPSGTYPTVSYYQALAPDRMLPPGYFRGKVVLVGLALQTDVLAEAQSADAFETPYTRTDGQLTAGVEVQANIYDNLRHQLWLADQPRWWPYLGLLLATVFSLWTARRLQPVWRLVVIVTTALGLLVLAWIALRYGRQWLSPVLPMIAMITVSISLALADYLAEIARRRQVQDAFGRYLSREMVQRIVNVDEMPTLGGESRDMTVLFADVRGFTTLSETLADDPQLLIGVINALMTPLSRIVFEHGGTIDKYMGDCIMAFWNAPLDDPDHPLHAVSAAQAMLAAMPEINAAIAREYGANRSLPAIRIGIGINSGLCVVGNMGSVDRFDYSVIGDTVNIASRLEGLCKTLEVALVIGETTRSRLSDAMPWVDLGMVTVRGRTGKQRAYSLRVDTG